MTRAPGAREMLDDEVDLVGDVHGCGAGGLLDEQQHPNDGLGQEGRFHARLPHRRRQVRVDRRRPCRRTGTAPTRPAASAGRIPLLRRKARPAPACRPWQSLPGEQRPPTRSQRFADQRPTYRDSASADFVNRAANQQRAQEMAAQRARADALKFCLVNRGYTEFELTAEQRAASVEVAAGQRRVPRVPLQARHRS